MRYSALCNHCFSKLCGFPLQHSRARAPAGLQVLTPFQEMREGECGGLLLVERSWTADEWTIPKIESQQAINIPRNADPNALPNFAGCVVAASEP